MIGKISPSISLRLHSEMKISIERSCDFDEVQVEIISSREGSKTS